MWPNEEEEEEEEVQDNPQSDCTYDTIAIPVLAKSESVQTNHGSVTLFSTTEPPGNMLALDSFRGVYYGASEPGAYSLASSNYVVRCVS